ncbi:MAG: hypothetical protein MSH60_00255 [Ruminococcus sp.]|nr:hypothetical protein [Ruminococcus sp.]
MADLIQLTTPIVPKNYVHSVKQPPVQNDVVFELADMNKIIKTNDRSEQYKQENSDFSENSNLLNIAKELTNNPKAAVETLKSLLSSETVSMIKGEGNEELLNKVTEFASEIMQTPESAADDLISQQKNVTLFQGKMWDAVRNMIKANPDSAELKSAVFSLLKNSAAACSQRDVLNSLAANMKFMAEELAPNKQLSAQFMNIAADLSSADAAKSFPEIKQAVLSSLEKASQSLLLSDKMRDIIPIVKHNLSRFTSGAEPLRDAFANLRDMIAGEEGKAAFTRLFADFVGKSPMPADMKAALLSSDIFAGDKQAGMNSQAPASENASQAPSENITQNASENTAKNLTASSENAVSENPSAKVSMETVMAMVTARLSKNAAIHTSDMRPETVRAFLSNVNVDAAKPEEALKTVLSQLLPSSDGAAAEKLIEGFSQSGDLNALADRLGTILNSIENEEIKMSAAHKLNEALEALSNKDGTVYKPPSSMETFTDFISKNINDPMLKALSGMNKAVLAENMLTTPGAETPLLHMLMPMEAKGVRAYGELWADNGAAGTVTDRDGGTGSHIFLSFDVENVGAFEMEIYAKNEYLDVMLLCPSGTENVFAPMKTAIPKIAASCGYQVKKTNVSTLRERRSLEQVFPSIKEKRSGLNVKV